MRKFILTVAALVAVCGTCLAQGERLFKDAEPYFTKQEMPDMTKWLPAPPEPNSTAFMYDLSQHLSAKALRETNKERAALAVRQALIEPEDMCAEFSLVFGTTISKEATPATFRLIRNMMETIYYITKPAKDAYQRTRPYCFFNEPTLMPEHEEWLRTSGSYPSGHTAIGHGVALVLMELNPAAANEIMKVGYQYGESRVITGYHWQSDVDAGRFAAGVAVAKMHTSPEFQAQYKAAAKELRSKLK